MRSFASYPVRLLTSALIAATAAVLMGPAAPAGASSITYAAPSWKLSQVGTIITVRVSLTASATIKADIAGVCARNSSNGLVDFPFSSAVQLSRLPVTVTAARSLLPGRYTMWPCVRAGSYWHDVGIKHPVVVSDPAATPSYPAPVTNAKPASPSGQPMPVGDLPGWHQVFGEDFTKPLAKGSFPGAYAAKWTSYHGFRDTSGNGMYNQGIISAHNGEMDLNMRMINGVPQGAAPSPIVTGPWKGQIYGRYTVRYRSDWLPGYGAGWLLWPDSNNWNDGEIDFPEGGLAGTMMAHNHCVGNPANNCLVVDSGVTFINWHTATIEWSPAGVFFILDGKVIGSDTRNIPRKPMHLVLQTGTSGKLPSASANGHVLIDWVSVYTLAAPSRTHAATASVSG